MPPAIEMYMYPYIENEVEVTDDDINREDARK